MKLNGIIPMRVINILAHLMSLLLGLSFVMASCQREDNPSEGTVNATPIELSPSGEWSDLSRGVIEGLDDLTGDGFVTWANWTKDPEDESIFTNDYSSGVTNLVFGEHGTKVYATDGSGDGFFTPVQQILDTWYYTPKRYWQRGTYTFAAALPATAFNASCVKEESDVTGTANITGTLGLDNTLTLTFGQDENERPLGFNLAANQIDLMFAVTDVDNCDENASEVSEGVSLQFEEHSFAQIVIEAASIDENVDIIVDKVTFSGNHKSTTGPINVSLGDEGVVLDYTIDPNSSTDSDAPYQVIDNIGVRASKLTTDADGNWKFDYKTIVSGLLVFPEESTMTLDIEYRASFPDSPDITSDTITGTVTTSAPVIWQKGRKYLYKLQISQHRVDIASSGVMDWNSKDITHTFN